MKRTGLKFESEAAMASELVKWLTSEGWEVYQEINFGSGLPALDIAAVRGPVVWAIECKLALNFEVIGQAHYWRQRANFASIAIPRRKSTYAEQSMIKDFLSTLGLGWLTVHCPDPSLPESCQDFRSAVGQEHRPKMNRPRQSIKGMLHEEHKTYAMAGTNRGGRFSPFAATCKSVLREVTANPGITPKELMTKIDHHYSSDITAKSCLIKWTEAGSVKGVRIVRTGRLIQFFPDAQ